MKSLLIVGGSDAGISAALRAKEIDPAVAVTMILADRFPNFSICGLPFYISGETPDWQQLAHRTIAEIEEKGVGLMLGHSVDVIDPVKHTCLVRDQDGNMLSLKYDKLVIGTGAVSTRPSIEGIDLPGVFLLRWMEDSIVLKKYLNEKAPATAVVVGGGYIGMEMADAFTHLGIQVTMIEYADHVLTTLDPEMSNLVKDHLEKHGVRVITGMPVHAIEQHDGQLSVIGSDGLTTQSDIVLVAAGARPNVSLAKSSGVNIGQFGAVCVNRKMETNVEDVYAAGDCAETWHLILGKYVYMPLGTTAHKQGRVAGENAAGGAALFKGSLGTQVVKIFDLVAARTGLRDNEAKAAGFHPLTVDVELWDHKAYYPGAKLIHIRITGDRSTQKLLGVQIIGHHGSEISKRVDVIAAALFNDMKMDELSDLDLTYTPPLSSPWDPLQLASQEWLRKFHAHS
ncbi:MAG TPA: FAD-dependent oxidoreductase [Deltaproteobacteria bacterium]|nr:FAD-dependent oxidoreductase [Deltaproteobacteria bacterium]HNS91274.1 FAD-dependent oxidoreductase [Deltaproteobacteria bacterium]HOD72132.1 FAD-dependent oxidoreductase [Deltaproteobacteria bacterium]HPA76465.1 FAD-dependent oxidoreductase [Deltaproteobacteria bacterium]